MSNLGDNSISISSSTPNSPIQLEAPESPILSPAPNSSPSPANTSTNEGSSQCADEPSESTKKLKSEVWHHFKKEKIEDKWKAICNHCKKVLGGDSKNGTKHLHDHLARCMKKGQVDIRQQVLIANQKKADGKLAIQTFAFKEDVTRRELAKMIIMHEYPLSIVDHVQFRKYSSSLQPLFNMPSRNTIKSDILKIYKEEKINTVSNLEANEGRIAITTDMWTADHQKRGYMAVTAHYIDSTWTLQKRLIRFEYVPTPHTKDVIASSLMKCFLDWNIDRKLSTITVDNCSVNDGVVELLVDRLGYGALLLNGEYFHMRCCAHILHLIVKDGLSVIGDGIGRIRDSVLFWSATPKRWEKFEDAARQLRIPTNKKLCTDVKTRWNSTYLMLETALLYKDVFPRCVQLHRDPLYKYLPTEDDWKFASKICEKFKLFYEITESFSGTKYVTANLYFIEICKIRIALNEWVLGENDVISRMAINMLGKFDKYWNDVHGIMGVATILDPRYKTELLLYYFEKIYGTLAQSEADRIVQIAQDLVREYEKRLMLTENELQAQNSFENDGLTDFDTWVEKKKQKKVKVGTELDRFLEADLLPRKGDFDILNWWKTVGPQYPILQAIVRDIYAIPISTVASEASFSTGGRLVNAQRNRLHPSTVEALACSQSWLWAKQEAIEVKEQVSSFFEDVDEPEQSENTMDL